MFVSIVTALFTAKMYPEATAPSLIALAINYTLLIPIYLNWVVKLGADLEMYIGAVERISLYINSDDNSTSYSDIDGSPCADDLMAVKPTEKCKYRYLLYTTNCAYACVTIIQIELIDLFGGFLTHQLSQISQLDGGYVRVSMSIVYTSVHLMMT